ncbi:PRELI domain-containing protein 1, mitochondrial-like isoform X3 [Stegostoma tigrinum]|uniref:PRELI domain-containing protein 1, mitochondrial-like isoform X2 n=1 Tax=Rhincodon typus TaxID=259920 RepID=UPI00202E7618|nr:PRELI domain-containing protein 1, mitochondrial-like isoform X2 [Rhincodon typus]XP_059500899.1 PRELI domain-containing protein 1, mitochondrial-like isoform X3 [Stegostoma tigrinum]
MVKHFFDLSTLKSTWDQVASAFWQRYPNPFSKHVLTEDVIYREVTSDNKLVSRRLFTKTNRLPRWGEMVFPANLAQSVFVVEDSIVDLQNRTFTTLTWNINHTRLMEFGLARFRRNQLKATQGFEYILSHLQGELPPKTLKETAKEATEKAKETALAATEKAKGLASKAAPQKAKQFV